MEKTGNQANLLAKDCMVTALMQLLREKPFASISVSEITRRAGVSRMTYYRNYRKKEDIFKDHFKDVLKEYYQEFKEFRANSEFFDKVNLLHCFSYLKKHKDFLRCMFQSGHERLLLTYLNDYLMDTWYTPSDGSGRYYTLQAFAGSLYSVFLAWLSGGLRESAEEIADVLYRIYKH